MVLARISIYLNSVLRYKFLILDAFHLDTLYLCEREREDLWLFFETKRGREQKSFGNAVLPCSHKQTLNFFFHSFTVKLDIIKVFYLPTDTQENCFKKNIKIYIKTAPTCFGAITIIRERLIRAC